MHLQLLNNGSHARAKYFSIVSFEKNGSYTIFLYLDIANLLHRTFTISVNLILSFIVALKLNRMHCFSNSLGNIHMNIILLYTLYTENYMKKFSNRMESVKRTR